MFVQPISPNFVLHPFIMGILERFRLTEFRKSERRHDSLGLVLRKVLQISCPIDSLDEERSSGGMFK